MEKQDKKIIDKVVKKLFDQLGIEGDFEVMGADEGIEIALETDDSGIVIGYHGDTLESLQLITSLCVAKELGKFVRVSIEVGGYKQKRTEWLNNLAQTTKEKAISQHQEISISDLKSWERRVVHLLLKDDKDVSSQSQGEGRDRVLVVSPKN